jgi:hypothetical protein
MSAPQLPPLTLGSLPISIKTTAGSLRDRIEQARTAGTPLPLEDAARCILEVCVQAADLHVQGVPLRLHPSNIIEHRPGHYTVAREMVTVEATSEHDLACVAPELKSGQPGNPRATVYAIGAILYELLTLERVGTGMKRPCDVVPGLPPELETVLGKALVTNPAYRPDDLYALAQAIHHLTPPGTVPPPPPADESALDNAGSFAVDVSLSLLPPAAPRGAPGAQNGVLQGGALPSAARLNNLPINLGAAIEGLNVAVVHTPAPPSSDRATNELAELKARLQADGRPHYVIVKDGMDHGPFTAVELLQQIAANTFVDGDLLRDSLTGAQDTIANTPDFAPFADHAQRHRDIKQEKEAILHVVRLESKSTRSKTFGGVAVLAVVLSAAGVWFLTQRGARNDQLAVHTDTATNVETEGNLNVPQGKGHHGQGRVTGTQNGIPMLSGGMSCEAAVNAYVEEINIGGGAAPADITQGQYASIMNNGSYFAGCGAPSSMGINICAAVQNGRAVGVTVTTRPSSPGVSSCIAGSVRRLSFPVHPKLDVVRVSF